MVESEVEHSGKGLTESNVGSDGPNYASCDNVVPVVDYREAILSARNQKDEGEGSDLD